MIDVLEAEPAAPGRDVDGIAPESPGISKDGFFRESFVESGKPHSGRMYFPLASRRLTILRLSPSRYHVPIHKP